MDPQTLAQQIAPFLTPFLPYLLKAGEKAAEEAGQKLGADAWERAKTLWGKLRPIVEARPAAKEAAPERHPAMYDLSPPGRWAAAGIGVFVKNSWTAGHPAFIYYTRKDRPMTADSNLRKLITLKRRRLQKLQEQAALFGINTPPHIQIEIEDLTAELAELESRPQSRADESETSPAPGGGAVYNIQIDQASGIAIGDGAQVVQAGPPAGKAGASRGRRCADLARHIRETLALLREYEETRRLADDPRAKRRAEREIAGLREDLARYEAEARSLGCGED